MITVDQIKAMLHQLTLFRVPLDEFEEWLTSASWNMHNNADQETLGVVGRIERLLSEHDGGYRSELELYEELRKIAGTFEISVDPNLPRVGASSARWREPIRFRFELSEAADKSHAAGFSYTPLLANAR